VGDDVGISRLVELLGLERHVEGGWFRETWRAAGGEVVPEGYPGARAWATGIYFLLHPGEVSRWHWVRSDEMWLWHRGGPLRLRMRGAPDVVLGPAVEHGSARRWWFPAGSGSPPSLRATNPCSSHVSSHPASTTTTSRWRREPQPLFFQRGLRSPTPAGP
jgi:uncharacterized protein